MTLNIYCHWQTTFVDNSTKLPSGKHTEEDINLRKAHKRGEMVMSYITSSFMLFKGCFSWVGEV